MDIHERTAANRRLLADFFDGLTEEQLETPSLCDAWTVREVAAHLAMPLLVGLGRLGREMIRARGSIDRASVNLARDLAQRPLAELTGALRGGADRKVPAPGVGPMGQMADGCIHLRDCARPLDLDADVPLEEWRAVLDWLPTKHARYGFVPKGRLVGLRLQATDQDWAFGDGDVVEGPSEALAMAVTGRRQACADLVGPGLPVLTDRLPQHASAGGGSAHG